jgi:hypothetical protein
MALSTRRHRRHQPPGRALARLTSTPVTYDQERTTRGTVEPARPLRQPEPHDGPNRKRPPSRHYRPSEPATRKIEARPGQSVR